MNHTFVCDSARSVTHALTYTLQETLPATAYRLYTGLHEAAVEIAKARGYHPRTSRVSFFCPAEVVAEALGMHRNSIYNHLPLLKDLGLIDARAHYTTLRGKTVSDGTVWCIKLNPHQGKSARLSYDDLKHQYRNLAEDVREGRTSWQLVQSKETPKSKGDLNLILLFALPPAHEKTPLHMTAHGSVECVLDVPYASREERGQMVDTAARAVAAYLGDDSVNFYRYLLWQLLRVYDSNQGDYWQNIYTMIKRAGVDREEGFARSAGALFVSRLKDWNAWELIRSTPPVSVAVRPMN